MDKLGWIKQVEDSDRYKQLAAAYLAAVAEKKRGGENKSALVVSPTHAEADRITQAIRAGLKRKGKLGDERIVNAWVSGSPDGCRESRPDPIRSGRHAPVSPERTGLHQGIAADCRREDQAADRTGQAVRGVPADAACPGRGRPRAGYGRRQDEGRQASLEQRLASLRPGIHQARRHHRRSRLGH